jgi:hypothetical protein
MERIAKLDAELNAEFHKSVLLREQIEAAVEELNYALSMGAKYRTIISTSDTNISFEDFCKRQSQIENDNFEEMAKAEINEKDKTEEKNRIHLPIEPQIRLYEKHRIIDSKSVQSLRSKYEQVSINPRLVPISQLIEEVKKVTFYGENEA